MVLIGGATAATRAAVIIPLDADFDTRADGALRLWHIATGRPHVAYPADSGSSIYSGYAGLMG